MPGARIADGERITLRSVESEDVPFLQRAYANPEIRYPAGIALKNRAEVEAWIDDESTDRFLVTLDGEDAGPGQPDGAEVRRIGSVTVRDADWKRPELGYWLVPAVHGEGYGTAAVSLVVEHVFRIYDTPAIGATALDFNEASQALLESLGFTEEGVLRGYRFVDGEHRDLVQYGLQRSDWRDRS